MVSNYYVNRHDHGVFTIFASLQAKRVWKKMSLGLYLAFFGAGKRGQSYDNVELPKPYGKCLQEVCLNF